MWFEDAITYDSIYYWQFWLIKDFYDDVDWQGCWDIVNGFYKMKWYNLIVDQPIKRTVQLNKDESHDVIELTAKFHSPEKFILDDVFGQPLKFPIDEQDVIRDLHSLLIYHGRGFCCGSETITELNHQIRYESQYRRIDITGPAIHRTERVWYSNHEDHEQPTNESDRWVEVPNGKEFLYDKAPDEELFKSTLLNENLLNEIIAWQMNAPVR